LSNGCSIMHNLSAKHTGLYMLFCLNVLFEQINCMYIEVTNITARTSSSRSAWTPILRSSNVTLVSWNSTKNSRFALEEAKRSTSPDTNSLKAATDPYDLSTGQWTRATPPLWCTSTMLTGSGDLTPTTASRRRLHSLESTTRHSGRSSSPVYGKYVIKGAAIMWTGNWDVAVCWCLISITI